MRRRAVVAAAALIAAVALIGLPGPAGSKTLSPAGELGAAAFTQLAITTGDPAPAPTAGLDAALRADGFLPDDMRLVERGTAPSGPTSRPNVVQPAVHAATAWKPPRYKLIGLASFYDAGFTAMRLPKGTVVRICGAGGCRTMRSTDAGPDLAMQRAGRVADLSDAVWMAVCGLPLSAGLCRVTVRY